MAHPGRVAAQAAHTLCPIGIIERVCEVVGVGAIDHEVGCAAACGIIYRPDGITQRLAGWQFAVCLDREGNND